jgi:hypothetical protein
LPLCSSQLPHYWTWAGTRGRRRGNPANNRVSYDTATSIVLLHIC